MLGEKVVNARVLDLFAGSGSLGIEALSRGSLFVVFVERERFVIKHLKQNILVTDNPIQTEILACEASSALNQLSARNDAFDLVFIDPPYFQGYTEWALDTLGQLGLIKPGGLIASETSCKETLRDQYGNFFCVKHRMYGDTQIRIYQLRDEDINGGDAHEANGIT